MRNKENFKSTFAIVHLSDLHIVSHKGDYSISLHKMIDHISEITKDVEKIIIVFTGDLVERGEFKISEKTIYKFFQDLYNVIGCKVIDIVFTPGNHDKTRGSLLLKRLKDEGDEAFWEKFKENDWKYFSNQFEDFLRITKAIREEIFKFDNTFEGTYGVQVTNVGEVNVCFLCINSAWLCIDDSDEGNLRVGRFQLDDLKSQYQKKRKDINLVIALMHHPTDWLTKDEQRYLTQYMTDEYRLNANIMLQGHIHEKETYNWYNQSHSLTTLVTGMGWDQQKEIKDNGHRYSLYEVNMDSAIVRVNTYVSDDIGKFNEDTEVYKENNIIFPLFVHKYLELSKLTFSKSEYPLFYPNYNLADNYGPMLNGISKYAISIIDLIKTFQYEQLLLKELINAVKKTLSSEYTVGDNESSNEWKKNLMEKCKNDEKVLYLSRLYCDISGKNTTEIFSSLSTYLDSIIESKEKNLKNSGETKEEFLRNSEEINNSPFSNYFYIDAKNKFYSFIGSLCFELHKHVFTKEMFDDGSTLRIHFRIVNLDETEIKYKKLFTCVAKKKKGQKKLEFMNDAKLSDIDYEGSMIEKSFKNKHSMLFSLNPSSNNHKSDGDWIDFITITPQNRQNIMKLEEETVPYISFGISVNSLKLQKYLRELAFIEFENLLSDFLEKFFEYVPFKIATLLGGKLDDYN